MRKKETHNIRLAIIVLVSLLGCLLLIWKPIMQLKENSLFALPLIPDNLLAKVEQPKIQLERQVPILMYHHIEQFKGKNPNDAGIFVSPQQFEAQMRWLDEHNFQPVTIDYLFHPSPFDKKPVVLTFDDGYVDAFSITFPILKKYHFQGTFFPIVDNIDKSGFLTQKQILEMQNAGMKFGSHSLTHPNLTENKEKAAEEIYGSKIILERILGQPVEDFCYPGGQYNEDVKDMVANSGYRSAVTTNDNENIGSINVFELNRINIQNDTDFDEVQKLQH